MSEKLPTVLKACLSMGAVLAGMITYMLLPPNATQVIATAFTGPQAAPGHQPEIRRVTAEEAKRLPNVLFVDVRSQTEYEAGHIQGAIWMPFDRINQQGAALPKGLALVLYCT